MKKKIVITGMVGFMGSHLRDRFSREQDVEVPSFEDAWFSQPEKLQDVLAGSDTVVHLAAMNRGDDKEIYATNIELVNKLIKAIDNLNIRPHVIFSSSTQTALDNPYGRSKKEGERILKDWSKRNNVPVTVLTIPNVFGDKGRPFYNSVVATFCHLLTHGGQPQIQVDKEVGLIYINELSEVFWDKVKNLPAGFERVDVKATATVKVTDILALLNYFKDCFYVKKAVPAFANNFEKNLYNTFLSYAEPADYEQASHCAQTKEVAFSKLSRRTKAARFSFRPRSPGLSGGIIIILVNRKNSAWSKAKRLFVFGVSEPIK